MFTSLGRRAGGLKVAVALLGFLTTTSELVSSGHFDPWKGFTIKLCAQFSDFEPEKNTPFFHTLHIRLQICSPFCSEARGRFLSANFNPFLKFGYTEQNHFSTWDSNQYDLPPPRIFLRVRPWGTRRPLQKSGVSLTGGFHCWVWILIPFS